MLILSTVIWINADPTRRLKIRAQRALHIHYTTVPRSPEGTDSRAEEELGNWKPYAAAGNKLQFPGLEAKNHHMAMQSKKHPQTKTFKYSW